jgi:endoribonuclease Dicer
MYNLLSIVFNCQNFRLMANEIPADNANPAMAIAGLLVHDQMIAEGRTTSSRYAKIKCAVAAVDKLQGLSAADFREQYGCDCKAAGTKHTMQDAIGVVI